VSSSGSSRGPRVRLGKGGALSRIIRTALALPLVFAVSASNTAVASPSHYCLSATAFLKGIESKQRKLKASEHTEIIWYFSRNDVERDLVVAYDFSDLFVFYRNVTVEPIRNDPKTISLIIKPRDVAPMIRMEFSGVAVGPVALLDRCFEKKECQFADWLFINKGNAVTFGFHWYDWYAVTPDWRRDTSVSSGESYFCDYEFENSTPEDDVIAAAALARYLTEAPTP
jgi:hypothetical protein